jgi:hypothetical protein
MNARWIRDCASSILSATLSGARVSQYVYEEH